MSVKEDKIESGAERIKPYDGNGAKGEQVETMFDSIAPAYDLMNTLMTLGMHKHWRNYALGRALKSFKASAGRGPKSILDVATGTGDLVFALHKRLPDADICGVDLSDGMLDIARQKLKGMDSSARKHIRFSQGDCLSLPYPSETFDIVTVAYGVRNFEDTRRGYAEMLRVLKPGGVICVVELCQPVAWLPLAGYKVYTRGVIPAAGRIISGDARAYSYLHESIEAAPQREEMTRIMREAGFKDCRWKALFPGVVCVYLGFRN